MALFLSRFNFNVATVDLQNGNKCTPQPFPKFDESTLALGINGLVKGSDVYFGLGTRKDEKLDMYVFACSVLMSAYGKMFWLLDTGNFHIWVPSPSFSTGLSCCVNRFVVDSLYKARHLKS